MLEEISAIEEALSRLTRIFKLAKDELNNSQCFPNTVREDSSFKRKQLQMNTRYVQTALNISYCLTTTMWSLANLIWIVASDYAI